ncbi:MAG: mannose-6-phosphate isomerase [Rhodocyclales bacterium]|nr:mannose-6-phosphate isomerase [Rhodocyclales bacterium]
MKARILLNSSAHEYFFFEGCYITEWSNSPDDADASIARARVLPGVTTHWHKLDGIAERYVILQGEGEVEVGGLPSMPVTTGDVVVIPAGTRQRIRNSAETDLVFLAVCTPRFVIDAYVDLEAANE